MPALKQLKALPVELEQPLKLVTDTGYLSETNVLACDEYSMTPLITVSRKGHHLDPLERFTQPAPLEKDATEVEKMRHLLLTMTGRTLYARRKCTVEPVIGIIKAILGFRQFSLRGLENAKGELNLVALAWNLKRMLVLRDNLARRTA